MSLIHYRSRILMGGALALTALLATLAIMGAVLPTGSSVGHPSEQNASLFTSDVQSSHLQASIQPDTGLTLQRAIRTARHLGVDSGFLARLSAAPLTAFQSRVLKINVTNFAQKPNYAHNHNATSVRKVRAFVQENDSLLRSGVQALDIPIEVIASILWVETKFGAVMGSTHVPSVYLSLMLCNDSTLIEQFTESAMVDLDADSAKRDSIRNVVKGKALKKQLWAVEQLKALDSIHRDGTMDVMSLKGSWAGAFGQSQFLPSSYRRWAVDGNNDKEVNLGHLSDAIHSVANYLSKNGWGPTIKERRSAVHHYNNSDAYVDAVFTLARKVQQ